MAVKKVCVISGRGVYSRRTGVKRGGGGSHINLTNDEEEGGGSALIFLVLYTHSYFKLFLSALDSFKQNTKLYNVFPLQVEAKKGQKYEYEATAVCGPNTMDVPQDQDIGCEVEKLNGTP